MLGVNAFDVLNSPNWTEAEKAVVKWRFGYLGEFQSALWKAIIYANMENLKCLKLSFPVEVEGYEMWTHGDLAERLHNFGLNV
jgi:hypothetical protein